MSIQQISSFTFENNKTKEKEKEGGNNPLNKQQHKTKRKKKPMKLLSNEKCVKENISFMPNITCHKHPLHVSGYTIPSGIKQKPP